MREILFKAKRLNNGEWIEGYFSKHPKGEYTIDVILNKCKNPPDSDPMWERVLISHEVDPETVCQYTGLKDKDGNKIFENDIVESYIKYDDFREKREKGILRYTYGMYEIQVEEHDGKPVYSDFMESVAFSGCPFKIKVLGNIFDNPELLNKGVTVQ